RVQMHRMRIASVLARCPRLVQFWFHESLVDDARFSPDGRRVVTAGADGTAQVWDTVTGRPVTPPLRHGSSSDTPIQVWDTTTFFMVTAPLRYRSAVVRVSFSPDGQRLVTASWDGTARLWDATTGAPVAPPLRHSGPVVDAEF